MPLIVHFAEIYVRLDQTRLRLVVSQTRTRIELFDYVHSALHKFNGAIQRPGNFFQLVCLQQTRQRSFRIFFFRFARRQRPLRQTFGNNLMGESVLRIERAKLRQQAFAQVARRHAQRIEFLYDREAFLDVLHRVGPVLRNLF